MVLDQLKKLCALLRYDDLSTVKVGFHCCVEQSDIRKPCSISTGQNYCYVAVSENKNKTKQKKQKNKAAGI